MEILGHNMTMVSYFLPLIRDIKSLRSDELAQAMADRWNQTFEGTKIGCPTIDQIQGGFRRGLCYVTTAVCRSLGKPDDCRELRLLRNYRDGYLMKTEEGRSSVQEYYNVAPTIVKRIDRSENSAVVYEWIWKRYLIPCVRLIEENRLSECECLYADMVRDLAGRYLYRTGN